VKVRLADELTASRRREFFVSFNHIRTPPLHLVKHATGDRVTHLEVAFVFANEIKNEPRRRSIALVGHLPADLFVLHIIEVKGIGIKNRIPSQSMRLMDLEIKAD
jgi:hypothetical protein